MLQTIANQNCINTHLGPIVVKDATNYHQPKFLFVTRNSKIVTDYRQPQKILNKMLQTIANQNTINTLYIE